ncbi:hypothetical protein N7509_002468 [Penicillium cosmopolitanum]|uniref:Uncharacterized protein n=1 Tax=Penicillium cosmopolitanum TaxID=1131564 RepID=A0A9X0BDG8_9EURO|nr:uncharacterized protein N7509_002468 [Penicillium cosmopolitanum]KAJ5408585.1 hypothetical protein N7509_002468 [Penicillium cosmopolitanum]
MALPISSPSPKLDRFQQAMESVYGDFSNIESPESWSPPQRSGGHRGRYLWSDAFGVINLLTMHKEYCRAGNDTVNDDRYLIIAGRLIDTVHDVLGWTRDGLSRLPGATDDNPLGGGLRIGKTDEHGSDCDGQYHHYLTIWMFALNRMSKASGNNAYNRMAVQLARAIHPKFFVDRSGPKPRMVWKMSMDLSAPLVSSEGNLDPIDGFVVFRLLQAAAMEAGDGEVLTEEINDYKRVMERKGRHFVSSDTPDLGMTLWTTHWFSESEQWALNLTERCFEQLYNLFEIDRYLDSNIKFRLAFREFGTCMGAQCQSEHMTEKEGSVDLKTWSDSIIAAWDPYMDLTISQGLTPDDLKPITRVMYASALIPGGFCAGYFGSEPDVKVVMDKRGESSEL